MMRAIGIEDVHKRPIISTKRGEATSKAKGLGVGDAYIEFLCLRCGDREIYCVDTSDTHIAEGFIDPVLDKWWTDAADGGYYCQNCGIVRTILIDGKPGRIELQKDRSLIGWLDN